MSLLKDTNYTIIQGWMLTELGLKGNELLVYAVIYGFSQVEGQVYDGSLRYLAEWTNSTKQGVIKNLKGLMEKGLIEKRDKVVNGVKFCEYYATKFNGVVNKVDQGGKQSLMGGGKQSLPNNKDIYKEEDNKENKKGTRARYGEYKNVLLADDQLAKLKDEFPNDWAARIEEVSAYCESTGKKYKNYLATIRNWARRDAAKRKPKMAPDEEEYIKLSTAGDLPF